MRKALWLVLLWTLFVSVPPLPAKDRGEVIVFHAGSLTVPFKRMEKLYEATHRGVDVKREAAGSRTCARKIIDLKKPCDIMASADVEVITTLLFPDYAEVCYEFATNQMVIAYTPRSRYARRIDARNWYEILARDDVSFGYADPEADPCGYRTVLLLQLAERFYRKPGILKKLTEKALIRPKSVELIALLETGHLDYAFEYRSVAVQHGLKYLELPREIDLSKPSLNSHYRQASIRLRGKRPGEYITVRGKAISYGVTLLKGAPHRALAEDFMTFLLSPEGGLKVLEDCGQRPIIPPRVIRARAR